MSFKVYFDFTCQFSYDFRECVDRADLGYDIDWRCFLRAQAAESRNRPGYRLFDHPEKRPPGLAALCAFHKVRSVADPHADAFHRAVLEAKHEQDIDIDDPEQLCKIAADVGIDADLVAGAVDDRLVLRDVAAEHEDAVLAHNVCDTPTIVSHDGETLYVRLGVPPEDEATARRVMKMVVDIALTEPSIRQLRRT